LKTKREFDGTKRACYEKKKKSREGCVEGWILLSLRGCAGIEYSYDRFMEFLNTKEVC
jgi:hypothetical protein